MKKMTPLETFDYKRNWLPGYKVRLHSDLDVQGKDWCRKNLERHQWSMVSWTDVYEHTFHFENKDDADSFKSEWEGFVDQ